MMMISVHSSGQPSTKMIACERIMNCTGVRSSASTHCSSRPCPPRMAKTAENSAEPTNSQHTMAVVFAVRNTASLVRFQSSVRAWNASRKAPAAPTAADSVAVVIPKRVPGPIFFNTVPPPWAAQRPSAGPAVDGVREHRRAELHQLVVSAEWSMAVRRNRLCTSRTSSSVRHSPASGFAETSQTAY